MIHHWSSLLVVALSVLTIACAPAAAPGGSGATEPPPPRPTLLRIGVGVDITGFSARLSVAAGARRGGAGKMTQVVNAFLTQIDDRGVPQPFLAAALPSQDAGTWTINPDGTMQTVWTLRPGTLWQDGQPLTAADVAFAYSIYRDRDLPVLSDIPERYMSSVVARDDRTFEVNWIRLYAPAGQPDTFDLAPLPSHLLGALYAAGDKTAFANAPFWTSAEYVGAGPYRVVTQEPGTRLRLAANPYFIRGTPRIEQIEVTSVPDRNALIAQMLSGIIDFAEHDLVQAADAVELQKQWGDAGPGKIYVSQWDPFVMGFQHKDVPNVQVALRDPRVRQALIESIDREALAHSAQAGLAEQAHTLILPNDPLFPTIDQTIRKYPFDLPHALRLMADAGWSRGADGMLRDVAGSLFDIQVLATPTAAQTGVIIANYWKQAGMNSSVVVPNDAEKGNLKFRATYPGTDDYTSVDYRSLTSAEIASEANNWRGLNTTGWTSPDYDALFARYDSTVTPSERQALTVQLEQLIAANLANAKLYYVARPAVASSTVHGPVSTNRGSSPTYLWNVVDWTVD